MAELETVQWVIEPPFNTLEIICHAANIPQESRPSIKTTKLVVPRFGPLVWCHSRCFDAGSIIDYIDLTWDQYEEVLRWAEHHALDQNSSDIYWSIFEGKEMDAKRLDPIYTKKSKLKKEPKRILRDIYKEMEDERAVKGLWNRKKESWITIPPCLTRNFRKQSVRSKKQLGSLAWNFRIRRRRYSIYAEDYLEQLQSKIMSVLDFISERMGLDRKFEG